MSKQTKLEAKQRMIAFEYAFKTPLSPLGPASAERIVGAAEVYFKFMKGGDSVVTETEAASVILQRFIDTAIRANESIEAEKQRFAEGDGAKEPRGLE